MKHEISIFDRVIRITRNSEIIQNGVKADTLYVVKDNEWRDIDSTSIVFTNGETSIKCALVDDNVTIPWEVLENDGKLYITIIGYKGSDIRVITEKMDEPFRVVVSGDINGDTEKEPTKDVIRQLQDDVDQLQDDVENIDDKLPFKLAIVDGRYGYMERGADTFHPFSSVDGFGIIAKAEYYRPIFSGNYYLVEEVTTITNE